MGISRQSGTKNKSHMGHGNSMNNIDRRTQRGFSLIELIVVIAIMATLIGLLAPQFVKYVAAQRKSTCQRNREAILRIYERAVYDGSVPIYLNTADLEKVANIHGAKFQPTDNEVEEYLNCPNHSGGGNSYSVYVDSDSGTAYIECPDCGDGTDPDIISSDMLGWSPHPTDRVADPTREAKPVPTPTAEAKAEYIVYFNANGHGTAPASQTVKDGDKVTNPGAPSGGGVYTFGGWYLDSACTSKYDFSSPVHSSFTLYAEWTGGGSSSVWPYADDSTWWNAADIESMHAGQYITYSFSGKSNDINNEYIAIKTPTGIFQSRTGALFVLVRQNDDGIARIKKEQASSPEYYSLNGELKQSLIHLTGRKTTVDISSYTGGQIRVDNLVNGDLVDFVDGDTHYLYVFWHQGNESYTLENVSAIKSYSYKLGNMYRVNP